jgi:aspartate racemase
MTSMPLFESANEWPASGDSKVEEFQDGTKPMKPVLGILGGLGPLASADFLLSLYDYNLGGAEQDSPSVIVYSDPTFPDRTEIFRAGRDRELLELVQSALDKLCAMGATKIVMACITLYHLVPQLRPDLRCKIISLPEIIISRLGKTTQRHLLITSSGTRSTRIFENHPGWDTAAAYSVWPDEADQALIHERIYREIKANARVESFVLFLEDLCAKYEVTSLVAGCTEIHRITRHLLLNGGDHRKFSVVDPLQIIAQHYRKFVDEQVQYSRAAVRKHQ